MKKTAKLILALGSTLLCFSAAYSAIPNNDDPTTFLGPTLKGRYTSPISYTSAFSLLGEAGLKNFRLGGTLAWKLTPDQRLKLSAEWLRQNIEYAFFSGNSEQWMNQWAVGAGYQYDLMGYDYQPSFDLDAYYSHAPSKTLSTRTGTFVNSLGTTVTYVNQRRIAGSNAAGIAPGFSFTPWTSGRASVALNYDNVRYDKDFSPNHDAKGFGGTVTLAQGLYENIGLGLSAAIRQPFNNYTASIGWSNVPYLGGAWTLALDGAYTIGKESLPNTWNIGLSLDYLLAPMPIAPINLKGDYKGEASPPPVRDPFWIWAAHPAVYMPQVLAIVDERVTTRIPGCSDGTAPVVIGTIPDQEQVITGSTLIIPTAQVFSGSNLVFSVIADPTPPNTVTIDPETGVVTIEANVVDNFDVTVVATNSCGTTSTTFNVDVIID